MKRVLFVFNSLGLGGSQKIEAFVANACKDAGYEVTILSFTKGDVGVDINKNIPISYIIYDRNKGFLGKIKKSIYKKDIPGYYLCILGRHVQSSYFCQ